MLDPSNSLPSTLRFTIDGREQAVPVEQGAADRSRRQAVSAVSQLIMRRSAAQIEEALRSLADALGQPRVVAEPSLVSGDELLRLAGGGLIDIGSHTSQHPFLADLSFGEQRDEVFGGKADLEALLGQPLRSFSYPNGSCSATTRAIVQEAGFACACGSKPDIVWRGSDPFELPRLWQANRNGEAFSRWMRRFL